MNITTVISELAGIHAVANFAEVTEHYKCQAGHNLLLINNKLVFAIFYFPQPCHWIRSWSQAMSLETMTKTLTSNLTTLTLGLETMTLETGFQCSGKTQAVV